MQTLEVRRELESAVDPAGYRVGILLSWLLVILGSLFAADGIFSAIGANGAPLLYGLLMTTVIAGSLAGSGLFLIRKAKMGLWGLYFLSAYWVIVFMSDLINGIARRSVAGPFTAIVETSLLLIWFSIVEYFFKRRRQFTGIWRS
jgi:hypothetical protein